jgi:hypothetical protein
MGYGIVGGWLVSFEEHGKEAATLALRVMRGESPASIPFGGEQAYVSVYDWREPSAGDQRRFCRPAGEIQVTVHLGRIYDRSSAAFLHY